jgi:hypothetical protein
MMMFTGVITSNTDTELVVTFTDLPAGSNFKLEVKYPGSYFATFNGNS